ncbi:MAG: PQQ-binding-like beta-propeller repeat protein [Planctomycetaceae bacterium]|nr:PQQ-binding-like beta-propeller repeat protein [Planctomycetaceae bacterium]
MCPFRHKTRQLLLFLLGMILSGGTSNAQPQGDYSGSLSLERNRAAEQSLQLARTSLEQGELAAALSHIQNMLDAATDTLVLEDDVYRSAWDVADDLLHQRSPAELETYERLYGQPAAAELAVAIQTGYESALQRVVQRYRQTQASQQACLSLTRLALDRGEPEVAAGWSRHLNGTLVDRDVRDSVLQLLSRIQSKAADATSQIAGRFDGDWKSQSLWKVATPQVTPVGQGIKKTLAELEAQSVMPLLSSTPVVHDGRVFVRQLEQLMAIDASNGDVLWHVQVNSLFGHRAPVEDPQNSASHTRSTIYFLERLIRSPLLDQMSTDGSRLFTIADCSHYDRDTEEYVVGNTLTAFSVIDGRLMWSAGMNAITPPQIAQGQQLLAPDPNLFDVYFLTTPQPIGTMGLVLGQYEGTLSLLAIDLTSGQLEWSVPLGQVLRSFEEDLSRHASAGRVTVHQGRAYCTTTAGSLACVDLLTRRLTWSVRYARDDIVEPVRREYADRSQRDVIARLRLPIRNAWRDPFLHVTDDRVIMASPDSDRLSAYDTKTGTRLWTRQRGDGLMIAGPIDDRLLILGNDTVIAVGIGDGQELWVSSISRPAGRGILHRDEYVFPTLSGGMQSVNLVDGQVTQLKRDVDNDETIEIGGLAVSYGPPPRLRYVEPRNYAVEDGVVVSQSLDDVEVVSTTSEGHNATASIPQDPAQRESSGPDALPSKEIDLILLAAQPVWNDAAGTVPVLSGVDAAVRIAVHLIPKLRSPQERAANLVSELSKAVWSGDRPETQQIVTRILRQPLGEMYLTNKHTNHSVRFDRWLQRRFWETVAPEPALRDGLTTQFPMLFAANRTPQSPTGNVEDVRPPTADDAAGTRYGMQRWRLDKPVITESESPDDSIMDMLHVRTVPMTVTGKSPWEWVTVQVDRPGHHVFLYRADQEDPVIIDLPPAGTSPRMVTELQHAWANGSHLCLRVGNELFGFRLKEASGELPRSAIWPPEGEDAALVEESLTNTRDLDDVSRTPVPLWDDSQTGLFDLFGRPYLQVGPATESYLCHWDRDRLIALDPQNGTEIWTRFRMPVGAQCVGDDQQLVLLRSDTPRVEVLSPIDGSTTHVWDWPEKVLNGRSTQEVISTIVAVQGTLALCHSLPHRTEGRSLRLQKLEQQHTPVTVRVFDLSSGYQLWTREIPSDLWPVRMDDRAVALIDPRGRISVVDWQSGEDIAVHEAELPEEISSVEVITHPDQSFLLVSRLSDDSDVFSIHQVHGMARLPIVNGWVHALSRTDGRHLWGIRLVDVGIPLDQPRHVPLLIGNHITKFSDENSRIGLLRCYDRRNGLLLYKHRQTNHIYHTVRGNVDKQKVELLLKQQVATFDYSKSAE